MRSFLVCIIICFNIVIAACLREKPIVVVDVDAGSDDAIGILMLLASHKRGDIQLKAITCVAGNTGLNNVTRNVLRLLEAASVMDIPVYKGAENPLLPFVEGNSKTQKYHGKDGFGDLHYNGRAPHPGPLQPEHAVNALFRIVSEQPNKVTLILLGPKTNVALAIKMFPKFLDLVKDIFEMGGNYMGVGNLSDAAEFNFGTDPEAAFILLEEVKRPVIVLPWETCKNTKITQEWRFNVMGAINNPEMHLMNAVEKSIFEAHPSDSYQACDQTIVAILLNPGIVQEFIKTHASVELYGKLTRGEMVLDYVSKREPNVIIVTKIDEELLKKMLLFAAGHNKY